MTGEYFLQRLSAWLPVLFISPEFRGVLVLLCIWLAVCSANCLTTSSVSSVSCATLMLCDPIQTTCAMISFFTTATLLRI